MAAVKFPDLRKLFPIRSDGVKLMIYDSAREYSYEKKIALIFLHGSPGQISNWKYQISYFEKKYRVIAYDQRGYGDSDKPEKVSLEDYIRDLDTILKKMNVYEGDVILIGHSFGGMVAQAYARAKQIKGLILIGSLVRPRPDIIDKIVWNTPPILWRRLLFTDNPFTRRIYRKIFFSRAVSEEIFREFIDDNKNYLESLPSYVFRYMKFLEDYDASNWLSEIRAPTLIVVGEDDKVTPRSESELLHKLIPRSKLVIIKDAGHLILYEKSGELNNVIDQFIAELENDPTKKSSKDGS